MYQYLPDLNAEYFRYESQHDQICDVLANISKHRDTSRSTWQAWDTKRSLDRHSFVGRKFATWQDVRRALGEVWTEGMTIYESMMRELENEHLPPPKSIRRKRRWSEDNGDEVSVDRMLRGQTYWDQSYREHRPGPLSVTILTDITTTCNTNPKEILWRGAAATLLTELLEKSGYRVELWAVQHCTRAFHNGRTMITAANLKRGGDALDVSTLINAVSGWNYRTMFFGTYCVNDSPPTNSLGCVTPVSDKIVKTITPDEHAVVCQAIWGRSAAIGWVQSQLTTISQTV
jgi:hypothetical protein